MHACIDGGKEIVSIDLSIDLSIRLAEEARLTHMLFKSSFIVSRLWRATQPGYSYVLHETCVLAHNCQAGTLLVQALPTGAQTKCMELSAPQLPSATNVFYEPLHNRHSPAEPAPLLS